VILVGVSVGSSEALQQCCSCARRLALNSSKYLAHALQALCFASVPMMALEQAARDHTHHNFVVAGGIPSSLHNTDSVMLKRRFPAVMTIHQIIEQSSQHA